MDHLLISQPKKQKVLFLDFDGVIRVPQIGLGVVSPDDADFCPQRIRWIDKVCRELDIKIVVSSDWRNLDNLEEIEELTSPLGEHFHKDWGTPICGHRHVEVSTWLMRHQDVTDYVILEDFAQHFDGCSKQMDSRIVWCDTAFGLTPELINEIYVKFS